MRRRDVLLTDDPVFGRLSHKSAWWFGAVEWPHGGDRVGVMIFRTPEVPTEQDRLVFSEIRDTYPLLLPAISQKLFSSYEFAGSGPDEVERSARDPAALLGQLRLECISIEHSGSVDLLYEGVGALFTVRIEGGSVQAGAVDRGRGPIST